MLHRVHFKDFGSDFRVNFLVFPAATLSGLRIRIPGHYSARLVDFTEKLVGGEASDSRSAVPGSREPRHPEPPPRVGLGKQCSRISRNTEIAESAEGPKLQGLFAESALTATCASQTILVT